MNLKIIAVAIALISVNYFTTLTIAQEPETKPPVKTKNTKDLTLVDEKNSQTDAPEWEKYAVPNEAHKALDAIAGKFTYTSTYWTDPKAKPQKSNGTMETKWILDGRFLESQMDGKMGDKPFSGVAITGYDTFKRDYQSVWMDSMSTAMWISTGKGAVNYKSFETVGTGSDPMMNDPNRYFRTMTKIINNNEHVFEMYAKDKNGKEFRSMEIRYKRAK